MIFGSPPSSLLALSSSPEKFRRTGRSSPPLFPKTSTANAVRSVGSLSAAILSAKTFICSVGVLPWRSSMEIPSLSMASVCFAPPLAASSMNRCILLIAGPTFSALVPALSKARSSIKRFPAVSPVRALRSLSLPPMSNASPNFSATARTPSIAKLIAFEKPATANPPAALAAANLPKLIPPLSPASAALSAICCMSLPSASIFGDVCDASLAMPLSRFSSDST